MTENIFVKAGAVVVTIAGVLGIGYTVAKYATDFDAAKAEIQNLRGQIEQLHEVLSKTQFGERGPKGEKGDPGQPGERGDKGDIGPRGLKGDVGSASASASVDIDELKVLVDQAVAEKLAAMPLSTNAASPGAAQISQSLKLFDTSTCIQIDTIRNLEVLTLRPGNEFCNNSGKLLFRVAEIETPRNNKRIMFSTPGKGSGSCDLEETCRLREVGGRVYIYERFAEDDQGPIALLRFTQ
jgi:hypothetical protein